jgi:hypothetical protein
MGGDAPDTKLYQNHNNTKPIYGTMELSTGIGMILK